MKKKSGQSRHWSRHGEEAAGYWQLKFLLVLFKILPVFFFLIIAFPVGFFYYLFSIRARTESRRFLGRVIPFIGDPKTAKKLRSPFAPVRHIISFSLSLIEKLQSWGGRLPFRHIHFQNDDIGELTGDLENGKGVFLVFSHLGNAELLRGLLNYDRTGVSRKIPALSIMDIKVTAHFNRMLKELNPQSDMDIIGVDQIGPDTAIRLEEILSAGGMAAAAGDRTSSPANNKNVMIPFLGKEALFSSGVFYLAALMKAPVYFVFCLRRGDLSLKPEYDMHVHKSDLSPEGSRKERFKQSSLLAESFASRLESYCKERPFQWYNFYDFWQKGDDHGKPAK
jgi:predicted LPLAT superfamily acyltransferase